MERPAAIRKISMASTDVTAPDYCPLRDPRMKWRNDADPVGKSFNKDQCWFVCDHQGHRKSKRESTEQLWNRVLKPLQPRPTRILELGSWEGASGLWTLHHLKPELWVSVDPWKPDRRWHGERYEEAKSHFFHNISTYLGVSPEFCDGGKKAAWGNKEVFQIQESSQTYLATGINEDFPGQPFDMCYIDAAHSSIEALTDMVLAWRKLAPGGLMLIDDMNRRYHNGRQAVFEAARAWQSVCDWCSEHVFENKRQLWIRKTM